MKRMRAALVPALAVLAAAILGSFAVPAPVAHGEGAPIAFDRTEIFTQGKITDIIVEDLDGDGRKDLLVILGREIRLFFQKPTGGFAAEPDQKFRLDSRAVLFDTGDLDGCGKKELAVLREDGVWIHRLEDVEGKRFYSLKQEKLVSCETVLHRTSDDEARKKEILRDVDGDGKLDILVPVRDGFSCFRNLGKLAFAAPATLAAPPLGMLDVGEDKLSSNVWSSWWIANPVVSDWDADGKPDIVLARESELSVWKPGADGRFPAAPVFRQEIAGHKAFSLDSERPFELDFTMPLVLRDLNHDGRVDAALTHVGQGTTRIFLNSQTPAEAFKTPAKVVRAKGVTFLAFFVDLDGDGLEDMILPRMDKIGIWSILKVLVTRNVPVEAQFFYQRKDGPPFPDEPDVTRTIDVPVALHSKSDGLDVGTTIIASVDGDFDKDGRKDLLYRTGPSTLSIFPGLPDRRGVADKASTEIEITNTDDFRFVMPQVEDLNGDGASDIVLRYYSWDRKDDRILVLLTHPGSH